jgi:hypothetical protein
MISRRNFLRTLGTAAVAGVVATPAIVELLAPKRTIFLPPHGGWVINEARIRKLVEFNAKWGVNTIPLLFTTYIDPGLINILLTPEATKLLREEWAWDEPYVQTSQLG